MMIDDLRIAKMLTNAKAELVGDPGYKLALVCDALHARVLLLEERVKTQRELLRQVAGLPENVEFVTKKEP